MNLRLSGRRLVRGLTLADLLVVVILIPVSVVIFLGCRSRRGEDSSRMKCSSNLRAIGQAILLYCNDEKGPYPRTAYDVATAATPTWGTGSAAPNPFKAGGPGPNDVSAALFLLLRTQDITPEVFTCPRSTQEKWDFGGGDKTAMNWSNWPGMDGVRKHLSYSFANPYPDAGAVELGYKLNNSLGAEFAVAADKNPGARDSTSGVLAVTSTSNARDMKQGNSRNHDGDGQNVLYGDGHVEFQSNPFVGVERDNIYTRRSRQSWFASDGVVASPLDAKDSVLLPTE